MCGFDLNLKHHSYAVPFGDIFVETKTNFKV